MNDETKNKLANSYGHAILASKRFGAITLDPFNHYDLSSDYGYSHADILSASGLILSWCDSFSAEYDGSITDFIFECYGYPKRDQLTGGTVDPSSFQYVCKRDPDLFPMAIYTRDDFRVAVYPYDIVAIQDANTGSINVFRID